MRADGGDSTTRSVSSVSVHSLNLSFLQWISPAALNEHRLTNLKPSTHHSLRLQVTRHVTCKLHFNASLKLWADCNLDLATNKHFSCPERVGKIITSLQQSLINELYANICFLTRILYSRTLTEKKQHEIRIGWIVFAEIMCFQESIAAHHSIPRVI